MSHSLVYQTQLACPDCGQNFAAEIWFVVDAAALSDDPEAVLRQMAMDVAQEPEAYQILEEAVQQMMEAAQMDITPEQLVLLTELAQGDDEAHSKEL